MKKAAFGRPFSCPASAGSSIKKSGPVSGAASCNFDQWIDQKRCWYFMYTKRPTSNPP